MFAITMSLVLRFVHRRLASEDTSPAFPIGSCVLISISVWAVGIFSICGAIFDWDWFMNKRKARFFVTAFARTGARIFYPLLGSGLIVLGILFARGIVRDSN